MTFSVARKIFLDLEDDAIRYKKKKNLDIMGIPGFLIEDLDKGVYRLRKTPGTRKTAEIHQGEGFHIQRPTLLAPSHNKRLFHAIG